MTELCSFVGGAISADALPPLSIPTEYRKHEIVEYMDNSTAGPRFHTWLDFDETPVGVVFRPNAHSLDELRLLSDMVR
ncbi:MAG: hypothetical protein ACRD1B_02540, partial [Thermoanaerobaculia bacterium]